MNGLRHIRAGLIGSSPAWEELLRQEGVSFGAMNPSVAEPEKAYSVVVLCRKITPDEEANLREYLHHGGALLACVSHCAGLVKAVNEQVRIRYIQPDASQKIPGLSLLDVESEGVLPREANTFRTNDHFFAVFAGELLGGAAVVLPFDPVEVMEDFRAMERYFYARPDRLPSERVSRTGKGEMLHLLHSSLMFLHHERGLPYARLWPFPDGAKNVFAFRIDTDGGTRDQIDELYRQVAAAGINGSWFLDVASHESWLGRFAGMTGQEIGLHCFEHRVFLDEARDADNIVRGRDAMRAAGLSADSFVAPFGFWSPELGKIIDGQKFEYSSEFGWAYDALPHYPVSSHTRYRTLQIPIHPVSVGSLRKAGYTSAEMIQYFRDVIDAKILRNEPLFFYHHPGHRYPEVVQAILECGTSGATQTMSLGAFASWWKDRLSVVPGFCLEGDRLTSHDSGRSEGKEGKPVWFEVRTTKGQAGLFPLRSSVELQGVQADRKGEFVHPEDVQRIREFDLRGEIGRQFTRIQRRFT